MTKVVRSLTRHFALALPLAFLVLLADVMPALAQDAMSNRYRAIRAPTDRQVNRIERQRLQSELNALSREETRVRSQRRHAERLGQEDPLSTFSAKERALNQRLQQIPIEQSDTAARLADLDRDPGDPMAQALPPLRSADPDAPYDPLVGDRMSQEDAVAAARSFVDELLRASRER